jgi:tetratricopeptide (TPR) repeat protein
MNRISYIIYLFIAASFMACGGGSSVPTAADISSLEAKYSDAISRPTSTLQNDDLNGIIRELVTAYESFSKGNHDDPASLGYLYKAAELYETNLGEPTKAIGIFDHIIENHGEHDRAADALFKKGYIYNNTFGDTARAHVAYNEFIKNYPNHPMHKDAIFEVANLGKSPEEILNEILQKKAAADSAVVE